ncbi:hypothetical protein E5288_WYG006340 [Bos mutus]|uniref:Uncharacterized protein n=1 Tax=Bos mutus TaxID=72004 RepID=A0A6B0QXE0_9CETA|nr:hypothetical protein [Bos mutus]
MVSDTECHNRLRPSPSASCRQVSTTQKRACGKKHHGKGGPCVLRGAFMSLQTPESKNSASSPLMLETLSPPSFHVSRKCGFSLSDCSAPSPRGCCQIPFPALLLKVQRRVDVFAKLNIDQMVSIGDGTNNPWGPEFVMYAWRLDCRTGA